MNPSIIRISVSKTPALITLTLLCLGVPLVVCGGSILGYWPDPLAFLDDHLIGGSTQDETSLYMQKSYILFAATAVAYGIFVGAKAVQHVSFLGEHIVVKFPFSQKRYPIQDLQGYRFEESEKRFYSLFLNFGYAALTVKIEDYQQEKIESFITSVKQTHRQHPSTGGPIVERLGPADTMIKVQPYPERKLALDSVSKISPSTILEEIQKTESKPSNKNALAVLIISIAAFTVFGYFYWSLELVVFILIAIFIHESGHLLAMRIFKYTNLKMLFLPLLGGVAMGRSKEENATKIALISIAGPLIGIVSAYIFLIVWLVTRYDPLYQLAVLSIALNAFNLLPIKPLDGGQFLNETLFCRSPRRS